jgi:uncharacterized protein (DUF488 family)
MYPTFNREPLAQLLKQSGFAYVYLGRELGARSDDPKCYEGGKVQYRRLAQTALFRSGIERVLRGAETESIALLCAEKEPMECHRAILVARELEQVGARLTHIHADGRTEQHHELVERLLETHGLDQPDMFRTREESIELAYAQQEARIAYVDRGDGSSTEGELP